MKEREKKQGNVITKVEAIYKMIEQRRRPYNRYIVLKRERKLILEFEAISKLTEKERGSFITKV